MKRTLDIAAIVLTALLLIGFAVLSLRGTINPQGASARFGAEVTDGFGQLCVRRLLRRQPGQPLAGRLRQALAGLHECLRDLTGHSGHAAGHTSDRAERGGQHLRQLTCTLPGLARFRGSRLGQLSLRRRGGTVGDRRRTGARGNGNASCARTAGRDLGCGRGFGRRADLGHACVAGRLAGSARFESADRGAWSVFPESEHLRVLPVFRVDPFQYTVMT